MNAISLTRDDALLIVDVQNDFLPGGNLAVPAGDEITPVLNDYLALFADASLPVFATRDWHPADHCSFHSQGGPWPPHCIAGSHGAALAARLTLPADAVVVSKAILAGKDAYSGFDGTNLAQQLHERGIRRLFIGGLATDYCVLNTVTDALAEGFVVFLLLDAIRAVDVQAGDGEKAITRMLALGAMPARFPDLAACHARA